MASFNQVTGLEFNLGNCRAERLGFKVHLRAASPANQVVVVVTGQFIGQVTSASLGGMDNAVPDQEFQRSVDGGLRHAARPDALIDLTRRKVSTRVQGLHYGKALGGHTIAARPQRLSVLGDAGHKNIPYCNFYK
jgi:hypothetical protein